MPSREFLAAMILQLDYGDAVFLLFTLTIGILGLVRGLQIRWAATPSFVVEYQGWSSPALSLPYGAVYMFTLAIGTFREDLPLWLFQAVGVVMMLSLSITLLGFFVWFPRCLLPGWYRRARKAGVPRHDPYAMARFKRLAKAEQRGAKWPNIPEEPDQEEHTR